MSALTRRLARLEEKAPEGDDRVRIIFVSFCERGENGDLESRLGLAQLIGGPNLWREEDETEGAFAMRVYETLTPAICATREDREVAAAGRSQDVALAKVRGHPITDAMLESAQSSGDHK